MELLIFLSDSINLHLTQKRNLFFMIFFLFDQYQYLPNFRTFQKNSKAISNLDFRVLGWMVLKLQAWWGFFFSHFHTFRTFFRICYLPVNFCLFCVCTMFEKFHCYLVSTCLNRNENKKLIRPFQEIFLNVSYVLKYKIGNYLISIH